MSDKLDRIAEGVARIDERTLALEKHIIAVSTNSKETDRKLDAHLIDTTEAHGMKAVRKHDRGLIEWMTFGLAALGTFLHLRPK